MPRNRVSSDADPSSSSSTERSPVLHRLERAKLVTVRWETPDRGVPRKYYRLTDAGRQELVRLTHEWTAFASAMTRLLKQEGGEEMMTADQYINGVIDTMPYGSSMRNQPLMWWLCRRLLQTPASDFYILNLRLPPATWFLLATFIWSVAVGCLLLSVYTAIAEYVSGQTAGKRLFGTRIGTAQP